jgi:hypothetical protein
LSKFNQIGAVEQLLFFLPRLQAGGGSLNWDIGWMEECGSIQQVHCLVFRDWFQAALVSITLMMLTLDGVVEDIYHALSLSVHFTKALHLPTSSMMPKKNFDLAHQGLYLMQLSMTHFFTSAGSG